MTKYLKYVVLLIAVILVQTSLAAASEKDDKTGNFSSRIVKIKNI